MDVGTKLTKIGVRKEGAYLGEKSHICSGSSSSGAGILSTNGQGPSAPCSGRSPRHPVLPSGWTRTLSAAPRHLLLRGRMVCPLQRRVTAWSGTPGEGVLALSLTGHSFRLSELHFRSQPKLTGWC